MRHCARSLRLVFSLSRLLPLDSWTVGHPSNSCPFVTYIHIYLYISIAVLSIGARSISHSSDRSFWSLQTGTRNSSRQNHISCFLFRISCALVSCLCRSRPFLFSPSPFMENERSLVFRLSHSLHPKPFSQRHEIKCDISYDLT
jgi:uncharacterized membrane protein